MVIIKRGPRNIRYVFDCDVCETTFALDTSDMRAYDNTYSIPCPICGHSILKSHGLKEYVSEEEEKNNDKR